MTDVTGSVIHTGQAIVDLTLQVDALPAAGSDTFARGWSLQPGGGFNVMAAARREGVSVVYTGAHGTGLFGDLVRKAMTTEGVQILAEVTADTDTGFCVAVVDDHAERTFVSTLGAEAGPDIAVLNAAQVSSGDVVYVSGYSLYHTRNGSMLASWLPTVAPSVQIVVDSSPMIGEVGPERLTVAIETATLWTLNRTEAQALLSRLHGAHLEPLTDEDLACHLKARVPGSVVLRAGAHGCWIVDHDRPPVHVPSLPVTAVDTNGAGDTHSGVLCAGLCRGETLLEACRRANAAAALSVTRHGPATAPTRDETSHALSAHNNRA